MSITFDSAKQCFLLNTPGSTYVIRIHAGRYLLHGGWFHRIADWTDKCVTPVLDYSFSPNPAELHGKECFSLDSQQEEYPVSGRSDFRTGAVEIESADGTCTMDLQYDAYRIIPGKPGLPGLPATYVSDAQDADTLEIDLKDPETGITVTLSYTVWNTRDVICRHTVVKNTGTGRGIYNGKKVILRRVMSESLDFASSRFRMLQLSGAHARERHAVIRPVVPGMQSVESRRGMSSHQENPFIALLSSGADDNSGEVFGFSLVYSGSFIALAEADQFHMTRVQTGINPYNFAWTLEAGDSFCTPETVMVRSEQGLGGMSRIYHDLYRKQLSRGVWRDKDRPVVINNWEATFFDFDAEKLFKIADAAAKTGAELFVLDDGWFGKRDNDRSSLGDWFLNSRKLPGGLREIADGMKKRGLKFGLWVEPEMISPDSDLYRAHPDWCLHIQDRSRTLGRHQCVLDMSSDDVVSYLAETLTKVFSSADISYVKWDYNRCPTEVGSSLLPPERQMETGHRYMLGLYRLLEILTSRFPDILFESCSGGGGRFDPGMFYYMPQCWTSDNTDALSRLQIQAGTSIVYPSNFMSCHVSAVPNQQVGRMTSLSQRAHVAMAGVYGYELDLTRLPESELKEIAQQIALYKKIRHTLQFGTLYRLETPWAESSAAEYTDYTAWEYTAEDGSQAVLTAVWQYAESNVPPEVVRLQGLDAEAEYMVTESNIQPPLYNPAEKKPVMQGEKGQKYSGAELMYAGLRLSCLPQYGGSVQIVLQKIE